MGLVGQSPRVWRLPFFLTFIQRKRMNVGDKVKIVRYGLAIASFSKLKGYPFLNYRKGLYWYDTQPHIVRQEDKITAIYSHKGRRKYALKNYNHWFNPNQLQKL